MMDKACCSKGACRDWGLLVLRVVVGAIFVYHGYGKLFGMPGMEAFTMMVDKIGFPLPVLFAYTAALSEFLGGLALMLGVWTRVAAYLTGFVMLVAVALVHRFAWPVVELPLVLLAASLALAWVGPGAMVAMDKGNGCGACGSMLGCKCDMKKDGGCCEKK